MNGKEAIDYQAYEPEVPDTKDLETLSNLVLNLLEAEVEVAQAQDVLLKKQKARDSLANHDIPELMEKVRMESFKTASGFQVSIVKKLRCSPPVANRPRCFDWLEKHGHGGLIKRTVAVAFSREQQEQATELMENLEAEFQNVRQEMKVEPATMTAFANERARLEDEGRVKPDDLFPREMFGAFEFRTTKLKPPKNKP